ncbi:hypothetical protein [Thalassomonas actiniarum]|uniref:Uncharacterized protein n=1 Tax=Thalassomonas actiniarum TaxID=485447 RepID=A0AAF0C3Q2_9GAMM|nr:hypothetical protein [Thalassomonas actiniarum]WDD99175.1 hypothetical protein SG35_000350 [Thalassomonas actiniarum]
MTINEYFSHYYGIISNGNLEELDQFFHEDSPFLNGVKQQYEAMRKQLDINIQIQAIELVAKQDDLLVIRDRVLFEGEQEGNSMKNQSGNLHVMTKTSNDWKLQSTTCLSVECL